VNPVLAGIYNRTSRYQKKPPVSTTPNDAAGVASQGGFAPAHSRGAVANTQMSAHQELARQAVGKGIRHEFGRPAAPSAAAVAASISPAAAPMPPPISNPVGSLTELASNYHNSLMNSTQNEGYDGNDLEPTPLSQMRDNGEQYYEPYTPGFLSRNSSLIDLAMIAPVEDGNTQEPAASSSTSTSAAATADASRGFAYADFFSISEMHHPPAPSHPPPPAP
jgi:hypothetical protein